MIGVGELLSETALLTTIAFALTAGVATFFSPCAYPLLPGYVAFYASQTDGEPSLAGSLSRGLVAGLGVFATFVTLLGVSYWLGHETLSNVVYFEVIIGAALVVLGGLVLFDRGPSISVPLPQRRSSVLGFGIFGAGYALAAAGCVLPLFVGVLGRAMSYPPATGALVLGTYVGSVVLLMLSLTVAAGMGLLATGSVVAHGKTFKRIAGAIMIVAGLGQLYLAVFVFNVI